MANASGKEASAAQPGQLSTSEWRHPVLVRAQVVATEAGRANFLPAVEDAAGGLVRGAVGDQVAGERARLVGRVELDDGFGRQELVVDRAFHDGLYVRRADADEAAHVLGIVAGEVVAKAKMFMTLLRSSLAGVLGAHWLRPYPVILASGATKRPPRGCRRYGAYQ